MKNAKSVRKKGKKYLNELFIPYFTGERTWAEKGDVPLSKAGSACCMVQHALQDNRGLEMNVLYRITESPDEWLKDPGNGELLGRTDWSNLIILHDAAVYFASTRVPVDMELLYAASRDIDDRWGTKFHGVVSRWIDIVMNDPAIQNAHMASSAYQTRYPK